MLKIKAVKIEVNTVKGLFGADFRFDEGLNIIRADNTSGKSTLFQVILYAMGLEQLLDGMNEKTMQAVLKDRVEFPDKNFHKVLSSVVFLELENGNQDVITTKRTIKWEGRSPKLIDVYEGSLIIGRETELEPKPMYVHDSGGASNETYGFHLYLEEFLGFDLPIVQSIKSGLRKLYIQSIFPAFFIEQKGGWTDFLANIPYFGLKNAKNRVFEFLLGLDVFEIENKKQNILNRKQQLIEKWKNQYSQLSKAREKGGVNINNLNSFPEILSTTSPINFYMIKDDRNISLIDFYEEEKEELLELEKNDININSENNVIEIEAQLNAAINKLSKTSVAFDIISSDLILGKKKLEQYQEQLSSVLKDLEKNKGAKKIYALGAEVSIQIADSHCPTCNQTIRDTLLPQDLEQTPMRIDENISYLEAQRKMIEAYLNAHKNNLKEKETQYKSFLNIMNNELRPEIRSLKNELISDTKLPSEFEIEKKLKQKSRVKFYGELIEELFLLADEFEELSRDWATILNEEQKIPKDIFSQKDRKKITLFENSFRKLVTDFGYRSKSINNIKISMDNYLPEIKSDTIRYKIRFDSSASDLIRTIWAYTLAFFEVSQVFENTNHLGFFAFDEPAQQNMSNEDFKKLLEVTSKYKDCQILIFASFNESDEVYKATTEGIGFKLHWIKDRLITPIS